MAGQGACGGSREGRGLGLQGAARDLPAPGSGGAVLQPRPGCWVPPPSGWRDPRLHLRDCVSGSTPPDTAPSPARAGKPRKAQRKTPSDFCPARPRARDPGAPWPWSRPCWSLFLGPQGPCTVGYQTTPTGPPPPLSRIPKQAAGGWAAGGAAGGAPTPGPALPVARGRGRRTGAAGPVRGPPTSAGDAGGARSRSPGRQPAGPGTGLWPWGGNQKPGRLRCRTENRHRGEERGDATLAWGVANSTVPPLRRPSRVT